MQGSSTGVPVGTIIIWPTAAWQSDMKMAGGDPDNYLECNGQAVDAGKYPKLVKIMATVPNYNGIFLRGYGSQNYAQLNGSLNGITNTTYSSNAIGVIQGDSTRSVTGTVAYWNDDQGFRSAGAFYISPVLSSAHQSGGNGYRITTYFDNSRVVPTSNEIRPVNKAVIYLIRAK